MAANAAPPLSVRPVSFNAAKAWIAQRHRHQPAITGWLFGVEILAGGERVGVAAAGRPARMLQDGVTCEIVRVATNGAPNACSFAYGALRRAAAALGYVRVITYTRPDESGASVRAAGFVFAGVSEGGEWSRAGRQRRPAVDPGPKLRWVWYLRAPGCICDRRSPGPLRWPVTVGAGGMVAVDRAASRDHLAQCEWSWFRESEHAARARLAGAALVPAAVTP